MPVSRDVIVAYLAQRGGAGGGAAAPVAPTNTVAPVVSGTAQQGQTLSCTTGTWTGDATIVFAYQWQRAGVNIGSATASTYVLVSADYGNAIRCVVTGTNGAGNASANSNATAAVTRTYAQHVVADGATAYYRMAEPSGTAMVDAIAANNGLYGNSPTLGVTSPLTSTPSDKAVTFTEASLHWASIPDAAALDLGDGPFTIEFWINRVNNTSTSTVIDKGNVAYSVVFASGNFYFGTGAGAWHFSGVSGVATTLGTWYHIAITKNANTVKVYENAVDITPSITNQTFADNSTALRVARDNGIGENNWFLSASLDEIAFYKAVLTPTQVSTHYAAR